MHAKQCTYIAHAQTWYNMFASIPCKIVSHLQMTVLYTLQYIFISYIVHESLLSNTVLVLYLFISILNA